MHQSAFEADHADPPACQPHGRRANSRTTMSTGPKEHPSSAGTTNPTLALAPEVRLWEEFLAALAQPDKIDCASFAGLEKFFSVHWVTQFARSTRFSKVFVNRLANSPELATSVVQDDSFGFELVQFARGVLHFS